MAIHWKPHKKTRTKCQQIWRNTDIVAAIITENITKFSDSPNLVTNKSQKTLKLLYGCKVWYYTTPYFLFPISSTQQIFIRLLSIETTIRGKMIGLSRKMKHLIDTAFFFICSELRLGEWEDTISLRPQQNLWHTTQTLHTSLRRKTHRQRYRHSHTSRWDGKCI